MMPDDRSAPGVRVVALAHERAPTGTPLDLAGRIIGFVYEDSATKADKVTLEIDNWDLSIFDRNELVGGSVLEVSWGYPGAMAPPRRVVLKTLKGFQTLSLEGHATSVLMNRRARTRTWKHLTRAAVVRTIAAEYGYEGAFADIADTKETFDTIHQSAETDARFLKRLAAREDFEFLVDDTGLRWRHRNQASPPTHVLTWFVDPGRGDVLSINVESNLARRVGRVEVRGRDPLDKTNFVARSTSESVERTTMADVIKVVDPQTGETALQERNATATVHATSAATATQAQRESDARFRRAERATVKLSMQVVGDPTIRAKQVIEVRGIASLSGKYYVTEARHAISSNGYLVDLKLTRDGTGSRPSASSATKDQLQGGESNRAGVAAPGALTEVKVIDPESGRAQIEYRGTPSMKSGDPEAATQADR